MEPELVASGSISHPLSTCRPGSRADRWILTAARPVGSLTKQFRLQAPVLRIGLVLRFPQAALVWERRAGKSGRQQMGDNAH